MRGTSGNPGPAEWLRAVADARGMSKRAKAVLYALLRFADWRTGECWPSVARLALASGWSERAPQRGIGELARLGVVKLPADRRGGPPGRGTTYRIDLAALLATGARGAPVTGDGRDADGCQPDAGRVPAGTQTGAPRAPKLSHERANERAMNGAPRPGGAGGWNLPSIAAAIDGTAEGAHP